MERKKGMNRTMGKVMMAAMIALAICLPALSFFTGNAAAATNNSSYYDQNEGTVLGLLVFFFIVAALVVFLILPQKKEKKLIPMLTSIGASIGIVAVIFGFIDLANIFPNVNFAFWTQWFNVSTMGSIAIALGWFFVLLATLIAVYVIKDRQKEIQAVELGIIGFLVWFVFFLIAYYVLEWKFLLGT